MHLQPALFAYSSTSIYLLVMAHEKGMHSFAEQNKVWRDDSMRIILNPAIHLLSLNQLKQKW